MQFEEATARLQNHSNAPSHLPEESSFLSALWRIENTRTPADLTPLYEDILDCLEVVNKALNGAVPSEVEGSAKSAAINRWLANSVTYILHRGWTDYYLWRQESAFGPSFLDGLFQMLWGVSCAWGAVLDGDIDSLREHIQLEGTARGLA